MKLYNCTKRLAKKYGVFRRNNKLSLARNLKPGSIINTCTGGNSVIQDICPVFRNIGSRSWVVTDFDITTTDGNDHSWYHCCGPAQTQQEIEDYFREWNCEEGHKIIDEYRWDYMTKMFEALNNGKHICDDNGIIYPEFKG